MATSLAYRRRRQKDDADPVELADEKCGELAGESPFDKYCLNAAELPAQRSFVELPVLPEATNKPGGHDRGGSPAEKYVGQHLAHRNMF
jgi:hypothetical protein